MQSQVEANVKCDCAICAVMQILTLLVAEGNAHCQRPVGNEGKEIASDNKLFCAAGAVRALRATPHWRSAKIITTLPTASPNAICR